MTQGLSSHIVAGYSSYEHIGGNNYKVNFTLIRDIYTNGASLDSDIVIQIYSYDGSEYAHEGNALTTLDSIANFEFTNTQFANPSFIGYEYGVYSINYELMQSDKDYYFVFQRCCRNPLISNIQNSGEIGLSIFSIITSKAQELQNSSISFDRLPPTLVPVNIDFNSPIEAISLDGDTLRYQLSPSYIGGGMMGAGANTGNAFECDGVLPQGPCFPPYQQTSYTPTELNFNNPFPAWDNLSMDPETGDLLGTPNMIGRYAYGFTIHEFRDGQIINSTNFDYLLDVTDFVNAVDENNIEPIKVLGNPSSDVFSITLPQGEFQLGLYDIKGQQIEFMTTTKQNKIELNINGTNGIYFLHVSSKSMTKTIKLIKL